MQGKHAQKQWIDKTSTSLVVLIKHVAAAVAVDTLFAYVEAATEANTSVKIHQFSSPNTSENQGSSFVLHLP